MTGSNGHGLKPCAIVARLRKSASILWLGLGRAATEIWGRLRSGITPETNAASTIIFVFSLAAIVLWYRSRVQVEGSAEVVTELV